MISDNVNILNVGVDMGTSWTAVMSDQDKKALLRSVVGYPKDIFARKAVGANFFVGDDALEKRKSLNIFFPLERGVIKNDEVHCIRAASQLLTYAVSLIAPDPDDFVCGIIGVPARALRMNQCLLLDIARDVFHVAAVVSEPFLVAYHLNKFNNSIIVDIGAGTIDICGMKGFVPEAAHQVTITKAGNYVDHCLLTAVTEKYPDIQMTMNLARKIKEKYGFVGPCDEPILVTLRENGKPREFDITTELRTACEVIEPYIVEALQKIIAGFDPEDQAEALENIYLAGGGSKLNGLDAMIEDNLMFYGPVKVSRVDLPEYAGCNGALRMAIEISKEDWQHLGLIQRME